MDCTESFRFASEVCHHDADCPRGVEVAGTKRVAWRCVEVGMDDALPKLRECDQVEVGAP
jgi:hypothetical protein